MRQPSNYLENHAYEINTLLESLVFLLFKDKHANLEFLLNFLSTQVSVFRLAQKLEQEVMWYLTLRFFARTQKGND